MRRCCLNQLEVKHKDAKAAAEKKIGAEEDLVNEAWSVGNSWDELRDCRTKGQDEKKKTTCFFFFNLECTNVCVYVYYMLTETNDGILRQGEPCNMETYHTLTLVLKSLKLNTYLYLSTYICFLCISSDLHQQ